MAAKHKHYRKVSTLEAFCYSNDMIKKKKSWFERIADIDAKQQAAVEKYNKVQSPIKRRNKHTGKEKRDDDNGLSNVAISILVALTVCLPILAWLLGIAINPTGWMSSDPSIFLFLPLYFWPISVPLAIAVIALIANRRKSIAVIVIFLTSIVYSLYILMSTSTADDSEFTG